VSLSMSTRTQHVDTLFDTACTELFRKFRFSGHCLRFTACLLSVLWYMRMCAHRFLLPQCNCNLHKKSLAAIACLKKCNFLAEPAFVSLHTCLVRVSVNLIQYDLNVSFVLAVR